MISHKETRLENMLVKSLHSCSRMLNGKIVFKTKHYVTQKRRTFSIFEEGLQD
jgi:hypothetical protein